MTILRTLRTALLLTILTLLALQAAPLPRAHAELIWDRHAHPTDVCMGGGCPDVLR